MKAGLLDGEGERWREGEWIVRLFPIYFIALFIALWKCKKENFKLFLKTKASCSLTRFPSGGSPKASQ